MENKNIVTAILGVMKDVQSMQKSMTVWTGNSSYKWVSDADVKEKIRESMIKNALIILPVSINSKKQIDRWEVEETWNGETTIKTKQSVFTEVVTKYLLMHSSWETQEIAWYGQWVDTQDKGAWKATTYALKNTLLNMFLIPTGKTDDTDNTHSDDLPVPQKKYFNYEHLVEAKESGNFTLEDISKVVQEGWFTVSTNAKKAIAEYINTWEVKKELFFNK